MSKFVEYFKGKFDSTISEKIKPENRPYIAYSAVEGLTYSEAVKENTINYFYIESLEDNNIITLDSTTWIGTNDNKSKLEYSNNATDWISFNGVDSITINNGERLYMRCVKENICKDINSIPEEELQIIMFTPLFKISNNCNIGGNINSVMFDYTYNTEDCVLSTGAFSGLFMGLDMMTGESVNYIIDASKLELPATELADSCYYSMFNSCTSLTTAPELPATTLAEGCYMTMFYGCTSLTTAPELPATELAEGCYSVMFASCTSLTVAPELPVTMLANDCYDSMFYDCTSLTVAPELPATTLAKRCYSGMFRNCTSLTVAPELPATELAVSCYESMFYDCTSLTTVPELPATELAESCYYSMFSGCTSLTTAPELPATELAEGCYSVMFFGCTSLTTAPELPATELAKWCYQYMFQNCNNLNYIKCLATDISAENCTSGWVYEVSNTGTFVKNPNATWSTGSSGTPSGWSVIDAEL